MNLTIVVIFFNMRREAKRTLKSLSASYQQGVTTSDYEVIAIDNNSSEPLDPTLVTQFGPNFRYHFHATDSVSPVEAVNLGARMAQGSALAVIVDGARMASPGLVRQSLDALKLRDRIFICARSWHLGPDVQPRTIQDGYNQTVEDSMLAEIDWQTDGYRLFDVATIAPSSHQGFLDGFPSECSWLVIRRDDFYAIGGFDTRFKTPGGGYCNHEFRNRAVGRPGVLSVSLLGEGVFHQVHGGVATNSLPGQRPHARFAQEYIDIIGEAFSPILPTDIIYFGPMSEPARRHLGA